MAGKHARIKRASELKPGNLIWLNSAKTEIVRVLPTQHQDADYVMLLFPKGKSRIVKADEIFEIVNGEK